jgi:hypothetical protein
MALATPIRPQTWRDKLRGKCFPRKDHLLEWPDLQGYPTADFLSIRTTTHLSFIDRLRVLVSGKLVVSTKTTTQFVIGENKTASVAFPDF